MRKLFRVISLLLTIALVVGLLPAITPSVKAANYGSNGKFLAPIEPPVAGSIPISSRAELYAIWNNLSGTYHLVNDIDLSGAAWVPLGTFDSSFSGTFDGQGYVIYNLSTTNTQFSGLFGHTTSGVIKNVGLENTNIDVNTSFYSRSHYGTHGIGGLIGYSFYTTITNCYNTGNISASSSASSGTDSVAVGGIVGHHRGGRISWSYNTGNITAYSNIYVSFAGGIVGNSGSGVALPNITITNCYNLGNVSAYSNRASVAGGIIGYGYGDDGISISNCFNSGSIYCNSFDSSAGGICGDANTRLTVSNCYNVGSVTSEALSQNSTVYTRAGGICALVRSGGSSIINSYNTGELAHSSNNPSHIGGICAQVISPGSFTDSNNYCLNTHGSLFGIQLTSAQMRQQSSFVGFDFDTIWAIDVSVNNGFPYLHGVVPGDEGGAENHSLNNLYLFWKVMEDQGIMNFVEQTLDVQKSLVIAIAHINEYVAFKDNVLDFSAALIKATLICAQIASGNISMPVALIRDTLLEASVEISSYLVTAAALNLSEAEFASNFIANLYRQADADLLANIQEFTQLHAKIKNEGAASDSLVRYFTLYQEIRLNLLGLRTALDYYMGDLPSQGGFIGFLEVLIECTANAGKAVFDLVIDDNMNTLVQLAGLVDTVVLNDAIVNIWKDTFKAFPILSTYYDACANINNQTTQWILKYIDMTYSGTAPAITTSGLSNGAINTAYFQTFAATGDAVITWSIDSGSLPTGLSLAANGIISGTPTTSGTFNFTIKATNSAGSDSKALSITINTAPSITSANNTTVVNGTGGTFQVSAIGDTPITYALTGAPAGVSINSSSGLITVDGTIGVGVHNFTITAYNGVNPNATQSFTLTVTAAPTYSISSSTLTSFGSLQTPYAQPTAQTVTITNTGTGAVTLTQPTATNYDIGTLSTTNLATNGATATFTVRPKSGLAVGIYDETIVITGTGGASATVNASFTITAPMTYPVITTTIGALTSGTIGVEYSMTLAATSTPTSWEVSNGTLPSGLTLNNSGVISGTPSATGTSNFDVTATNGDGTSLPVAFSITILPVGFVPVSGITIMGTDGATAITTDGGTLQMSAAVLPDDATNKAVTWSVTNDMGSATISNTGLLTAASNGMVTVIAVANDGSGVTAHLQIEISGQAAADPTTFGVTVNGSYATTTGAGEYAQSSTVTISAGSRSNYSFNGWTTSSPGVTFTNASNATTTFTMPANAVTVTANWTYTGGGGSTPSPSPSPSPTPTPGSTPAPDTIPGSAIGSDVKTDIAVSVNIETGAVTVNLDVKTMETLIEKAITAADTPYNYTVPTVTLDLSSVDIATSAVLNVEAALMFSEAEVAVKVLLPDAEITLSPVALAALAAKSNVGTTLITVEAVAASDLTAMQAAQVKGFETVVSIEIHVGDTKVDVPLTVSLPYTLKANENPAAVRVWHMADNGNLTDLHGTFDATTGMITFTISHQSYFVVGYDPVALWVNPFRDIAANTWYYDAIAYANYHGLFRGVGGSRFAPNSYMAGSMFVTVLWNLEGRPAPSDGYGSEWFAEAVQWAHESGIVNGLGGEFNPRSYITRQEMAVILFNYANFAGYELPKLRDAPNYSDMSEVSSWAVDAVLALSEAGVMTGVSGSRFAPLTDSARSHVAQMFQNFMRLVVEE